MYLHDPENDNEKQLKETAQKYDFICFEAAAALAETAEKLKATKSEFSRAIDGAFDNAIFAGSDCFLSGFSVWCDGIKYIDFETDDAGEITNYYLFIYLI